jgi:Uncharacterised nucleotidyltransferase
MLKASAESSGRLVAQALTGAWRLSPPALELTPAELDRIAPQLLKSGAGALGWWRVRNFDSDTSSSLTELHQAYRLHSLQALIHEREIEQVFKLLNASGVEPLLVKGWAVARLYPEKGLRPYGDIDLCVRPHQFAAARSALSSLPDQGCGVDLHCGFEKFGGRSVDEIYARSLFVQLGETMVRQPGAEDHLRALCIHMLREGAWRPLWLCDIAAAVETLPANFDWDCCMGKNRRWSNWITCALRLAHQLLGANIKNTPAAEQFKPLPQWLIKAVLKEWGSLQPSMVRRHRAPMASYLRHPSGLLAGFRHRWPNPIEATIVAGGTFNELPRLPFQIGCYVTHGAKFAARLPRLLREK